MPRNPSLPLLPPAVPRACSREVRHCFVVFLIYLTTTHSPQSRLLKYNEPQRPEVHPPSTIKDSRCFFYLILPPHWLAPTARTIIAPLSNPTFLRELPEARLYLSSRWTAGLIPSPSSKLIETFPPFPPSSLVPFFPSPSLHLVGTRST